MPNRFAKAFALSAFVSAMVAVVSVADESKPTVKTDAKKESDAKKTWHWPKVVISKETTYFTEPLRPDGGVDYVAALNRKYSQGVTPENNAAVALWQAAGPKELDSKIRKRYFEMLGIAELPETGDYLVEVWDMPEFKIHDIKSAGSKSAMPTWADQLSYATYNSWTEDEFPLLALSLQRSAKPMRVLAEGLSRSRFFAPLEPLDCSSEIIGRLANDGSRQIASDLSLRAMHEARDATVADKWRDAMMLYRLERLLSQRCFMVDWLLSIYSSDTARRAAAAISQNEKITADEAKKCQGQLLRLPPMRSLSSICDEGDRCYVIETMMMLASTKDSKDIFDIIDPEQEKHEVRAAAFKRLIADENVDWTEFLRSFNTRRDRLVAALKCPITNQTLAKLATLQNEAKQRANAAANWVLSKTPDPTRPLTPQAKALCLVDLMEQSQIFLYGPTVRIDLKRQTDESLAVLAFALAGYRAEHQGKYPETLVELAPKYIDGIPKDPITNGEFRYKSDGDGYLLYGVGYNGRDDGGRGPANMPESATFKQRIDWDDVVIRTPPKKTK